MQRERDRGWRGVVERTTKRSEPTDADAMAGQRQRQIGRQIDRQRRQRGKSRDFMKSHGPSFHPTESSVSSYTISCMSSPQRLRPLQPTTGKAARWSVRARLLHGSGDASAFAASVAVDSFLNGVRSCSNETVVFSEPTPRVLCKRASV